MKTTTIEVDIAIHKMIESERRNFDETANDVLRRLLGLSDSPVGAGNNGGSETVRRYDPHSWRGKGVELPNGTELRCCYPGVDAHGEIRDSRWYIDGVYFPSPSAAACHCAEKCRGRRIAVNGWLYWEIKRPTDSAWRPLNCLRDRVERRQRRALSLDDLMG